MSWVGNDENAPSIYWAVTVFPPNLAIEEAVNFFYGIGVNGLEWENGEQAESPFFDIPLEPSEPFVRAYFPDGRDWPGLQKRILQGVLVKGWEYRVESVRTEDWAENWKQYYQPISLGEGFVIMPAWYQETVGSDRRNIWIDPGMAFGTGTHPTTRMCLDTLLTSSVAGRTVLDLGSGSGILAILAAKLGARSVVAVDPDPVAVQALSANVGLNGLDHTIRIIPGTLHEVPNEDGFDIFLMNLIAEIILDEWGNLQTYWKPNSQAILSGILESRMDEVWRAVEDSGRRVRAHRVSGGWALLVVA